MYASTFSAVSMKKRVATASYFDLRARKSPKLTDSELWSVSGGDTSGNVISRS